MVTQKRFTKQTVTQKRLPKKRSPKNDYQKTVTQKTVYQKMITLFPVVVTKISASCTTSSSVSTVSPSMSACRAQIGSTSLTTTLAPAAFMEAAHPLPTSPYPAIKHSLPIYIDETPKLLY